MPSSEGIFVHLFPHTFETTKKSGEKNVAQLSQYSQLSQPFQFAIRTWNKTTTTWTTMDNKKNTGFCPVLLFTIPLHKKLPVHADSQAHL